MINTMRISLFILVGVLVSCSTPDIVYRRILEDPYTLVLFHATHCIFSTKLLAKTISNISTIDISQHRSMAYTYGVRVFPKLILFRRGLPSIAAPTEILHSDIDMWVEYVMQGIPRIEDINDNLGLLLYIPPIHMPGTLRVVNRIHEELYSITSLHYTDNSSLYIKSGCDAIPYYERVQMCSVPDKRSIVFPNNLQNISSFVQDIRDNLYTSPTNHVSSTVDFPVVTSPTVLLLLARWCAHYKAFLPVFKHVQGLFEKCGPQCDIQFGTIDISQATVTRYNQVPTIIYINSASPNSTLAYMPTNTRVYRRLEDFIGFVNSVVPPKRRLPSSNGNGICILETSRQDIRTSEK